MIETSSEEVRKFTKLDVLIDVANHLNQVQIARKYGKSKATICEFFKENLGTLIKKVGYGTWELTELGKSELDKGGVVPPSKMGEFFYDDVEITYQVRLKDTTPFKDGQWNLNKFTTFSSMNFGEWYVRNNANKSITIVFPKIPGDTELEPFSKAFYWADRLIHEIVAKYPQIEIINPIPKISKAGSLGSTKLNQIFSQVTKNVTIRGKGYDYDNTPIPGSFEVKVDLDHPFTAARKLKDVTDFIMEGGFQKDIDDIRGMLGGMVQQQVQISNAIMLIAQLLKEIREERK
jgi:hypothetical protein